MEKNLERLVYYYRHWTGTNSAREQICLRDIDMSFLRAVAEARKSGKTLVKLPKRHKP